MTAAAPTWGEVERFLQIDGWRKLGSAERGGSRSAHVFYEKLLDSGRLLQTHVSHSRAERPSPGRFSSILREQVEVSRDEFWGVLQTGEPVDRPAPPDEDQPAEHEAWVLDVLANQLHVSAEEIATLSVEEARQRVWGHWGQSER